MKLVRRNAVAFGFVVLSFVVVAAFWSRTPDRVPIDWDIHGTANGWAHKPWGPLLTPLIALGITLLLAVIPALAPKERPVERFGRVYTILVATIAAYMLAVTVVVTLAGIGVAFDTGNVIGAAIGVLFAVIGNFLGKVTQNHFVGIRTPWTLANEEVWLRTHRLGGKLFVGAGLAALVGALFGKAIVVLLSAAAAAVVVPVVYSFLIYRRLARAA